MSNPLSNAMQAAPIGKVSGFFGNVFTGVVRGVKGLVTDMAKFQDFSQVIAIAKPGDLIEIQRGLYSHYVLYLGDGKVMNIEGEDNTITEARIRESTLEEVCKGSKAQVRNHDEVALAQFQASPRNVDDIINAARSYEEQLVPYQFDFRNCEYYCTLWRYGVGFSTQAAKPTSTPVGSFVGKIAGATKYASHFNSTAKLVDGDGFTKYKELMNASSDVVVSAENAAAGNYYT